MPWRWAIGASNTRRGRGYRPTALSAKDLAHAVQSHWGIENRNHHVRDVTFREDAGRIRANGVADIARERYINALNFENMLACLSHSGNGTALFMGSRHESGPLIRFVRIAGNPFQQLANLAQVVGCVGQVDHTSVGG